MKKVWLMLVLVILVGLFPTTTHAQGTAPKGLIPLWSVRLSSQQTIGSVWGQANSYEVTCKAEVLQYGGKTHRKVLFWPLFYGAQTMVSRDIECWSTQRDPGRTTKWLSAPHLFRQLASNQYEPHTDLIWATQVRSFSTKKGVVCKANTLAFHLFRWNWSTQTVDTIDIRVEKVIFSPGELFSPQEAAYFAWSSRDLTCTADRNLINSWLRNRWWTYHRG
jgi:hypothetical protein